MSSVYEISRRDNMTMSETSTDIASGTYLYYHLYHPDSTSPVFVPYDESYVQSSGNVCIPGEDYKRQWARLEQKIPVDGMGPDSARSVTTTVRSRICGSLDWAFMGSTKTLPAPRPCLRSGLFSMP